jgi:predicted RNA methylase
VFASLLRLAICVLRRSLDRIRDRHLGIETAGHVTLDELGIRRADGVDYEPSSWRVLNRVLRPHDIGLDDVFLDLGCGKGRVVIQAARYRFKRVIGVEVSPVLAVIARANVERVCGTLACRDIEIVTQDVLDYEIPDAVTVVFFYNPFEGATFRIVVDKIVESIARRPRVVRIVYYSPREENALLSAGARLVKVAHSLRPTRNWSALASTRLYELKHETD